MGEWERNSGRERERERERETERERNLLRTQRASKTDQPLERNGRHHCTNKFRHN